MEIKNGHYLFEDELAIVTQAEKIWYDEWVRLGMKDEGTCCLGKGIHIRSPFKAFIRSQAGQGNISAWESSRAVLDYLGDALLDFQGTKPVSVWYDDGRID